MKVINVINIIAIALAAWFLFSWADVISDNNSGNPQHSDLNFFSVMLEWIDGGEN